MRSEYTTETFDQILKEVRKDLLNLKCNYNSEMMTVGKLESVANKMATVAEELRLRFESCNSSFTFRGNKTPFLVETFKRQISQLQELMTAVEEIEEIFSLPKEPRSSAQELPRTLNSIMCNVERIHQHLNTFRDARKNEINVMIQNSHLDFDEGWAVVEKALNKCWMIMEGGCADVLSQSESNAFHDCAYRLCSQNLGYTNAVCDGYKKNMEGCVRSKVIPHLMACKNDLNYLSHMGTHLSNFSRMVDYISELLSYTSTKGVPCLKDTAANSFFRVVFSFCGSETKNALLSLIRQEREGGNVDMKLLMGILNVIYRTEFKTVLANDILQDTYAYYSRRGFDFVEQCSSPAYFEMIQGIMEKETIRLAHYLCVPDTEFKDFSQEIVPKVVLAPWMQASEVYHAKQKPSGEQILHQSSKVVRGSIKGKEPAGM